MAWRAILKPQGVISLLQWERPAEAFLGIAGQVSATATRDGDFSASPSTPRSAPVAPPPRLPLSFNAWACVSHHTHCQQPRQRELAFLGCPSFSLNISYVRCLLVSMNCFSPHVRPVAHDRIRVVGVNEGVGGVQIYFLNTPHSTSQLGEIMIQANRKHVQQFAALP